MSGYELFGRPEMFNPELFSSDARASKHSQLVLVEEKNAIEFFAESGDVFHSYSLPEPNAFFSSARHFFRYYAADMESLRVRISKNRFLQTVSQLIYRLANHRRRVSILDLGTTVSENYHLLKSNRHFKDLGITLEYVGLELDKRLVSFAREIHLGDPNYSIVQGEISDLGRFPDQTFDLVTSHFVHQYGFDQRKAFTEAVRVARVATVLTLPLVEGKKAEEFAHATTSDATGYVFKAPTMRQFIDIIKETDVKFVYFLSQYWRKPIPLDNNYIGKIESTPRMHSFVLSKYPVFG